MIKSGDGRAARGPLTGVTASLSRFLLLFVATRLVYVVLVDPIHLVHYGCKELYRGTIAQELITGLKIPFTEYRADNYSGGSLVIGVLAAAFFLLFGPTVFALKLAPLLLFTLALAFWYCTVQRAAGERVAGYVALLFCFSLPQFTAYSLTAMGFHSESILFSALTVFLLFRMLSDGAGSPVLPALLGLTAGFGLWFTYIYGVTLLAMLLYWVWYEKGMLRRWRILWFALGFLVGFSPWIIMNLQNHFAGLMVQDKKVWEHFGFGSLLDSLAHPRELIPYEFFANFGSDDPRDLYRRSVNLFYSLLFLGPILTAAVLRLKTLRSDASGPRPTRLTLAGFATLYLIVLALALQFTDFRGARYYLPAYPFLFLLLALSLARLLEMFPLRQKQIQTVFLGGVVVLGVGAHAPVLSLDRPGYALSAKGFAYAMMPISYLDSHPTAGSGDGESILEFVETPFLSDILPKLSPDDERELSRGVGLILADAVPLTEQAQDFSRIQRLVPPGFDNHFSYSLGVMTIARHPDDLPKAVAAVEFLRHRSPALHHLALVGIYRSWSKVSSLDASPESLVKAPAALAPELSEHYWRALGHLAGRYWSERDRSLNSLNAHLQSFVPRLDPSAQRYFLQGIGERLFAYPKTANWVPPAALERFPQPYQQDLLEGWGMALAEFEFFSPFPWRAGENPFWTAWTRGLSARGLVSVQQGRAYFDALFEGPTVTAQGPARQLQ